MFFSDVDDTTVDGEVIFKGVKVVVCVADDDIKVVFSLVNGVDEVVVDDGRVVDNGVEEGDEVVAIVVVVVEELLNESSSVGPFLDVRFTGGTFVVVDNRWW